MPANMFAFTISMATWRPFTFSSILFFISEKIFQSLFLLQVVYGKTIIAGCLVAFFGHNLCKLNDGTHLTLYRQGNNDAVSYLYIVGIRQSPSLAATRYSTRKPFTTKFSGNSSIAIRTCHILSIYSGRPLILCKYSNYIPIEIHIQLFLREV